MASSRNDADRAAYWAIRMDAGELSPADQAEVDAWLATDPRRDALLLRAQATLCYLDRARAITAGDFPPVPGIAPRVFPNRRAILAIAATLVAGISLASYVWQPREDPIATKIGEIRDVALEDGSSTTLNTATQLVVSMSSKRRDIRLNQGEAWFNVAKDKARPFVVATGNIRVRAVGTAFSVRRLREGAEIMVNEGVVTTWNVDHDNAPTAIPAGSVGLVSERKANTLVRASPDGVERGLAWRHGQLALNGQTLGYAVAQINRYNERKLIVGNAKLAGQELVGQFKVSDPEKFARAIAAMTGADILYGSDTIVMDAGTE